jgi:hypothetical protein
MFECFLLARKALFMGFLLFWVIRINIGGGFSRRLTLISSVFVLMAQSYR